MHLLLDTHVFIWWLKNDSHLTKKALSMITEADEVFVSSVSIWEAAIKIQIGKLNVNLDDLIEAIESEGFIELPLTVSQTAMIMDLPGYHRDPFDRMLIAQAMHEPLKLLTSDKILKQYSELVEIV